jgi:hypothetical protein
MICCSGERAVQAAVARAISRQVVRDIAASRGGMLILGNLELGIMN